MKVSMINTLDTNRIIDNTLPPKMDIYAIYLRKSRKDIEAEAMGAGETLKRHKEILIELAEKKGLYVGKIYSEIVSGETIEARPEIQKLIADCYAGLYRGIIIVEVTRLSRGNQGDAQKIIDCLKYANNNTGLLVVTPTKTYDVAHNSDDEEYMEFELFMSRREYKMIQKRLDRGRKQAVVEGNYMGSYRPYGWNIIKSKRSRTLTPHPQEFDVGKMMYEWRIKEKMSPGKIAKRLTSMGIPTYRGELEWSKDSVKSILMNPVNMGKVRWNDRMRIKTMVDGKLKTSRPRSNHTEHYMLFDGKHEAMVDEETFMEANKDFKTDKTKSGLKLINPLAGLLACKSCGKMMHYSKHKGNTRDRYTHPLSQFCTVKSAAVNDVMDALTQCLKLYIDDFEVKVDNLPDVDEGALIDRIDKLQAQLKATKRKLEKAFDDYENGIYTSNEFLERKSKHNATIESIEQQIAEIESTMPEKVEYEEKVLLLSDALESLQDDEIDAQDKNQFLKNIIEKIDYSRDSEGQFVLDVHIK